MSLWVAALVRESGEGSSGALLAVVVGVWVRSLRRMRKVRLWR